MLRFPVLNLPPLPPPPNLGCGGGDTRCKKRNKESPPWVCEKCAKKRRQETYEATLDLGRRGGGIGCPGPSAASVEVEGETSEATLDLGCDECQKRKKKWDETSEATLDLGRTSVGCGYEPPEETSEATLDLGCDECQKKKRKRNPNETSEATLDLGCDKCQKGKKRRRAAAARNNLDLFPSGILNLRGPMLRQVPLANKQWVFDETSEPTLDLGGPRGMLGQVPLVGLGMEWVGEETSEPTLDLGRRGMGDIVHGDYNAEWGGSHSTAEQSSLAQARWGGFMGQVPLVMGNGGHGGRSVPYEEAEYALETSEATLDLGQGRMLGQVPLVMGGSGRGGESIPFIHEEGKEPPYDAYLMGQRRRCLGAHGYLGQAQSYPCPISGPTLDPTLNCQRDARGNAVCSNGQYFPPGCPHTPPEQYFSPGIAPDVVTNGIIQAQPPPPRQAGTTGTAGAAPAGGATPVTATNVLPYAAGGLAALGLLYAVLR